MNQVIESYVIIEFSDASAPSNAHAFSERVSEHLRTSALPVLVDCGHIDFLYSNGIKQMLASYKACRREDVYFGLINVNQSIRSLLNAVKLDSVLEIFTSLEEFKTAH